MAEYIDRAEAVKAIEDLPNNYNGFSDTYDKAQIIGTIEEIPFADVAPVRRGHWIYTKKRLARGGCVDASECSICHKRIMPHLKPNYCPNCGAKMEEEGDG